MNLELYNKLMEERPSQHPPEWQMFLEICEMYLEKHGIKNPVVVELGVWHNMQKKFWEQLFGAEHIGIDASVRRCTPDIHGNTHDPGTLKALKKKLGGKLINILFIDASHRYEAVKMDFELYSPLCSNIVALHDIEIGRHSSGKKGKKYEVWKFWDELKEKAYREEKEYEDFLFLSIYQCYSLSMKRRIGIGVVIKK